MAILKCQIQVLPTVDRVARHVDAHPVLHHHISITAAEHISGDGNQPDARCGSLGLSHDQHVGAACGESRLQRIPGDCVLADHTVRRLQYDLAGHIGVEPGIVFNVVASDLNVVHIAVELTDAGSLAITDVIALDDHLVQVALIE